MSPTAPASRPRPSAIPVLTQFDGVEFDTYRIPFVDAEDRKPGTAALRIKTAYARNIRPIVINTVVDPRLTELLAESAR